MSTKHDIPALDLEDLAEHIGENHLATANGTPVRDDAFVLSEDEKIEKIEGHFREIMNIIGLDMTDDSLRGTPQQGGENVRKGDFFRA